jgi:hypothetical protein
VTVGIIGKFYPGNATLTVVAHKEVEPEGVSEKKPKHPSAKYLTIEVVGSNAEIGISKLTPTDIPVILRNLEKMAEESSKSADEFSYSRPQNNFSAGIEGSPHPSVNFMVGSVLVATLTRSEPENRETLQKFNSLAYLEMVERFWNPRQNENCFSNSSQLTGSRRPESTSIRE